MGAGVIGGGRPANEMHLRLRFSNEAANLSDGVHERSHRGGAAGVALYNGSGVSQALAAIGACSDRRPAPEQPLRPTGVVTRFPSVVNEEVHVGQRPR